MTDITNILALDVGDARVGVAIASTIARLPRPLDILQNEPAITDKIKQLAAEQNVKTIVVGLPRNMAGEETKQSRISRQFAKELAESTGLSVVLSDESLSSKRAEQYGAGQRRPGEHLDDIAACFILEEYLGNHNGQIQP